MANKSNVKSINTDKPVFYVFCMVLKKKTYFIQWVTNVQFYIGLIWQIRINFKLITLLVPKPLQMYKEER